MRAPPSESSTRPSTRRTAFGRRLAAKLLVAVGGGVLAGALACATGPDGRAAAGAKSSQAGADDYVRKAVRKSSEGVVFFPSDAAQREYDLQRLNEIARALRQPFAICFLRRAIETMEPTLVDGEKSFAGVPEGQMKFRARIGSDGRVVVTEVLESAFADEWMETCVQKATKDKRFPPTRSGYNKHIDIVYWVSLGFFDAARTPEFALWLRKEQVRVVRRAERCLEGRVAPGSYVVEALNLFDRNGDTVANRVTRGSLPDEAIQCLDSSLKQMRIEAEPDAFVRPVAPHLEFTIADDGALTIADGRWLELIEAEERALRDEKRRELMGTQDEEAGGPIVPAGPGEVPGVRRDEVPDTEAPPETQSEQTAPTQEPEEAPDKTPDDGALRLRPR